MENIFSSKFRESEVQNQIRNYQQKQILGQEGIYLSLISSQNARIQPIYQNILCNFWDLNLKPSNSILNQLYPVQNSFSSILNPMNFQHLSFLEFSEKLIFTTKLEKQIFNISYLYPILLKIWNPNHQTDYNTLLDHLKTIPSFKTYSSNSLHQIQQKHKLDIPPSKPIKDYSNLKNFSISYSEFTSQNHSFYTSSSCINSARISKQQKILSSNLPCEPTSAIFISIGSNRNDLLKSLITGPIDSPYQYGLFLFELSCPDTYPEKPPLLKLLTTGNGNVRFNPNLYSNGFVCLSVINTWKGRPQQMWNPSTSNIFQVLMSVQSLVMDSQIIQKQPAYSSYSKASHQNRQYTLIARYNTIKYAMIHVIDEPPKEFEEVVKTHFLVLKQEILKMTLKWLAEAKAMERFSNIDRLVRDHNRVTCEFFVKVGLVQAFEEILAELKRKLELLEKNFMDEQDDFD